MSTSYSQLLRRLQTCPADPCAVLLYVDIRRMRSVNREAGPRHGDRVIDEVERCLAAWAGSTGVAGRLWSNEFVAAKPIDHAQAAVDEAELVRTQLTSIHYPTAPGEACLTISIGLAVVTPGCEWPRMVEEAGQACENAKQRGFNQVSRNRRRVAHPSSSPESSGLIANFRKLALQDKLVLHPQPIMDIRRPEPRLAKAEFLLRFIDGDHATPLPVHTIETLEHFGLAAELDNLASSQLLEWLANNLQTLARLEAVSLNLSARSIVDGHFINRLYSEVKNAHLPEGKLCFEITETAAIENLEVASEVIALFQDIGCKFSLDDFGSGLCSFAYLHTLQVDEVKIDGRFTRDIARNFVSLEIVRAIQQVAKATGKKTVAEFVDAPEKLAALQEIGVDYGQGWLFSPCVTPEALKQMLQVQSGAASAAITAF